MPNASPEILANPRRLAALERSGLVDSPPEPSFDRLTRLASAILHTPRSYVSLITDERQFLKSHFGIDPDSPRSASLDRSFCQHVVATEEPLVIADAREHSLVRDNLAIADGVIAYAGIPLRAPDGEVLGSFCVVDEQPRTWTPRELAVLSDLAASVMTEIHLRVELDRRRDAEAALRRSDERYRVVALFTDTVIWEWDLRTDRVTYTGALANITGEADLNPTLDTAWWVNRIHPEDRVRVDANMQAALSSRAVEWSDEYRFRRTDGAYACVLDRGFITRDDDGKATRMIGSMVDVTAQKDAEAALRAAKEAAEHASEAKSDFLSRMSHELRTPLNSIIGFAGLLAANRRGNLQPGDITFADRIRSNGVHLLGLINDILDLAKIEARKIELHPERVDLARLAGDVLAEMESRLDGKDVVFRTELPPKLQPLTADAVRLKQVIINLVGNALKFTAHGAITLRICADDDGTPRSIDVCDTGIGIPANRLDAIFEAFEQADGDTARQYGGTGLGLAICRELCALMGFRLEVESEVGCGSTFRIAIPEGRAA